MSLSLPGPPRSVARGAPGYPAALEAGPRPPGVLYYRGALPPAEARAVAIVGSRAASGRGCALAREMGRALSAAGVPVISGGAYGIDAAAHEGALDGGGPTWAVLGCGLDVAYPDRHAPLFERIAAQGGLLSEHPAGTPPHFRHFPSRNRIVVALSQAVVVVEAAVRSGALITARLATRMSRRLLVVPGTRGTDALLRSGVAAPVDSGAALLGALAGRASPVTAPAPAAPAVVEALPVGGDTAGGLARRLGLPMGSVMRLLTEAELGGWLCRLPGGRWIRADEVTRGH